MLTPKCYLESPVFLAKHLRYHSRLTQGRIKTMMRWRTFMIGWTMALVVLLIAHPKRPAGTEDVGTAVVELTYAAKPHSPANRQWNANVGHSKRVVAPLVMMDV